jgi:hypothetical protein
VHLVCQPLFDLLYQPQIVCYDECEAVSGMSGRAVTKYLENTGPVLLCPSQIPHDLTWARTQVAAVGSRQLTGPGYGRALSPTITGFYFSFSNSLVILAEANCRKSFTCLSNFWASTISMDSVQHPSAFLSISTEMLHAHSGPIGRPELSLAS